MVQVFIRAFRVDARHTFFFCHACGIEHSLCPDEDSSMKVETSVYEVKHLLGLKDTFLPWTIASIKDPFVKKSNFFAQGRCSLVKMVVGYECLAVAAVSVARKSGFWQTLCFVWAVEWLWALKKKKAPSSHNVLILFVELVPRGQCNRNFYDKKHFQRTWQPRNSFPFDFSESASCSVYCIYAVRQWQ